MNKIKRHKIEINKIQMNKILNKIKQIKQDYNNRK